MRRVEGVWKEGVREEGGVGGEGEEGSERDRGGKIFSQFMYR